MGWECPFHVRIFALAEATGRFSFKSVLWESRRIAVFSDLSLLLLYVCAVTSPLFCDFRRCFSWQSQCLVHWYQEATNMWQGWYFGKCNSFLAIITGQAQSMSFGLLCFVFCVLLFVFRVGLSWKRQKAKGSMYGHACFRSFSPSIKRAKIKWNVHTSAWSNTWGAKHNQTTRTRITLGCKMRKIAALNCWESYGCSHDTWKFLLSKWKQDTEIISKVLQLPTSLWGTCVLLNLLFASAFDWQMFDWCDSQNMGIEKDTDVLKQKGCVPRFLQNKSICMMGYGVARDEPVMLHHVTCHTALYVFACCSGCHGKGACMFIVCICVRPFGYVMCWGLWMLLWLWWWWWWWWWVSFPIVFFSKCIHQTPETAALACPVITGI